MIRIRPKALLALSALAATLAAATLSADETKAKAVIVTGQMNPYHSWEATTEAARRHLDESGRFTVETLVTPAKGEDMSGFAPQWGDYDVVVLVYDGDEWAEPTQAAFTEYVENGGGLVVFHSSDNAFPQWQAFLDMTGVGGWGGRDESFGPMLRWRGCGAVHDHGPGRATHPPQHEFLITHRDTEHPITKGLPDLWLHARDELYSQLRGPAENLHLLATGYADPETNNATGEHEPVLFTVTYGEGRIFRSTLGHVGANEGPDTPAVNCTGFVATFLRGSEWAATGKVTLPAPDTFPTPYKVKLVD